MGLYEVVLEDRRTVSVVVEAPDHERAESIAAEHYNFQYIPHVDIDGRIDVLDVQEKEIANLRRVVYCSRDLGYGTEEGEVVGTWGKVDTWGKRTFTPANGSPALYLFADEVVSDEEIV